MAKNTTYRQARLRREELGSVIETVSWIPSKNAKVGHLVSLKGEDGVWSKDFTVVSIGNTTVDEAPRLEKDDYTPIGRAA